jgi:hypothetical protein
MKSTEPTPAPPRPGYGVSGAMLAEFEAELATTRKFLERVPAEKLAWRPHEKSMTAGQLALHVAQVPLGVLTMAMQDAAPPPNFAGGRQQPATVKEVLDALERRCRVSPQSELQEALQQVFRIAKFRLEDLIAEG